MRRFKNDKKGTYVYCKNKYIEEVTSTLNPFCEYIQEIANKPYEELSPIEISILYKCYYILRKHKEIK